MRQIRYGVFTLALCAGTAHGALAQQTPKVAATAAPETTLGEVVVTAQRHSESLQKVPISVTALSAVKLKAANISNTADLAAVTPSLTFSEVNGNLEPRIRGVGNSTAGASVENSVATYIDGVYISSATGSLQNLNNVQRVEVLDGPQGTLFGRNATGGLVQIITKDPKSTFGGNADVSYANYNTSRVNLYLTGPVLANMDADLALYAAHQGDGWGKSLYDGTPTYRTDHDIAARSKWLARFGDATTVRVAFDYSNSSGSNPSQTTVDNISTIFQHVPADIQAAENKNRYDDDDNTGTVRKLSTGGTSIRLDQDVGVLTLTDIAAYRRNNYHISIDADGTPLQALQQIFTQQDEEVTEEFQVAPKHAGKLQWIAGIYYFHLNSDYDPLTVLTGAAPKQSATISEDTFTTQSVSGYGQATYEILPQTRVTGGFRYTYEKRTEVGETTAVSTAGVSTIHPLAPAQFETDTPTWRLALEHDFAPQILGYVSWNRGFKSGGYNPTSPTQPAYQPETLDDYEIGEKGTFFDRRLRLNAALFYYSYKNIQVNAIVNSLGVIYNGAQAEEYGLDANFDFSITPDLLLTGGIVAIHDRFTNFPDAVIAHLNANGTASTSVGSAKGNQLAFAPTVTLNLGVDYKKRIAGGQADLFVNDLYNSGYFGQADNFLHQSAYHMLNASLQYQPDQSPINVSLWAKNILNVNVAEFLSISSTGPIAAYEPPATYGITVGYKF